MPASSFPDLPAPNQDNPWLATLTDTAGQTHLAQTKTCLAPLAQLAMLRVHGADGDEFLQGQLSNDLRHLGADNAQLAALSSPKGRMLAVLQLARQGDDVTLSLHRSVADATLKRLRMFVLRAKVTLEMLPQAVPALGLWGPDAATRLEDIGLPAPAQPFELATLEDMQVIRHPGAIPRFELRAPQERLAALWQQLEPQTHAVGSDGWRLLDILAGVPAVYPQTADHFVAQMANLDVLGGVSFDKGCYTGQEVIARLHFLGKLKRRMYLLEVPAPAPEPGTPIHKVGESTSVGEVVDAVASDAHNCLLTAVLKTTQAEATDLRLGRAEGVALSTPKSFIVSP